MNKTIKIYLIIFGLIVAVLGILELNKKPVINWQMNYDISEKSPFGLYIFNQEAESFFNNNLEKTTINPYLFLRNTSKENANYLAIEKDITREGFYSLLKKVKNGSNLFWATQRIPSFVLDTLNFETTTYYDLPSDTVKIYFKNKRIKRHFILDKAQRVDLIIDTLTTTQIPLAYERIVKNNKKEKPTANCLTMFKFGKGKIFLFTQPITLTNYYLLKKQNADLVPYLFARMPKQKTIWFQNSDFITTHSPLRFILENKNLKYAWQIILFTLIFFALFNAKRRQRIIPIKIPNTNKSVEFVKSVGNLYLQEGNSKDMAQKKATYFLERVRNELYIPTEHLDETFAKKLQLKTNQNEETIQKAIRLIEKAIHPKAPVHQTELVELNKLLDQIYK